jgi:hypothetical protein
VQAIDRDAVNDHEFASANGPATHGHVRHHLGRHVSGDGDTDERNHRPGLVSHELGGHHGAPNSFESAALADGRRGAAGGAAARELHRALHDAVAGFLGARADS